MENPPFVLILFDLPMNRLISINYAGTITLPFLAGRPRFFPVVDFLTELAGLPRFLPTVFTTSCTLSAFGFKALAGRPRLLVPLAGLPRFFFLQE